MSDRKSMLPASSTDLMKALDLLEGRLLDLPEEMITKDPAKAPVAILDHLAWENSVDVWDPDWPDDVKRAVIAISAEVHRYKGTPYAIRTALSVFDVDTEFIEWWQPEGVAGAMERGTFQVTAFAGTSLYGDTESVIDLKMINAMNAVVQRVAPVSRGLDFRLGERFATEGVMALAIGITLRQSDVTDANPRPHLAPTNLSARSQVRVTLRSEEFHDLRGRTIV